MNFYNTQFHNLEVSKSVIGNMGDRSKKFNFTIEFYKNQEESQVPEKSIPKNSIPYNPANIPDGVKKISDGVYSFTLADTEKIIFENLQHGVKYNILEDDYSTDGYITKISGVESREISGEVTNDINIEVLNEYNSVVPTNIRYHQNHSIIIVFMLFSLVVIIFKIKSKS